MPALLAAMREAGIPPADSSQIVADGVLRRYDVEGEKPGRRNGWYKVHADDRPAGAFGSWDVDALFQEAAGAGDE